jgi:hypothetical protein
MNNIKILPTLYGMEVTGMYALVVISVLLIMLTLTKQATHKLGIATRMPPDWTIAMKQTKCICQGELLSW